MFCNCFFWGRGLENRVLTWCLWRFVLAVIRPRNIFEKTGTYKSDAISLSGRAKSLVKLWMIWMNSYQIRGVAAAVPVIRNVTTVHDARQNIFHVRPRYLHQKKKCQSNATERTTKQKTKQRSNYYRMLGITTTPHISVVVVWCSAVVASTCSTTTTNLPFHCGQSKFSTLGHKRSNHRRWRNIFYSNPAAQTVVFLAPETQWRANIDEGQTLMGKEEKKEEKEKKRVNNMECGIQEQVTTHKNK